MPLRGAVPERVRLPGSAARGVESLRRLPGELCRYGQAAYAGTMPTPPGRASSDYQPNSATVVLVASLGDGLIAQRCPDTSGLPTSSNRHQNHHAASDAPHAGFSQRDYGVLIHCCRGGHAGHVSAPAHSATSGVTQIGDASNIPRLYRRVIGWQWPSRLQQPS